MRTLPSVVRGEYLLLMLLVDEGRLWTTIRRSTSEKLAYYRDHIGEKVICEIKE